MLTLPRLNADWVGADDGHESSLNVLVIPIRIYRVGKRGRIKFRECRRVYFAGVLLTRLELENEGRRRFV